MSVARTKLVKRASLLREASTSPDLISKAPSEARWNEHARLVKAALCISAFTALEDFVQARIREVVSKLHGYAPGSRALSNVMKSALVNGAFEALIVRIKDPARFGIVDARTYLVMQAEKIASFGRAGLDPSDLTLSTNGSNVSWKVLEDALLAFSVENPASVVSGVARRLEGGIFVAKDHFENILKWRHQVAHVADCDVPLVDVRDYVDKLTLFCASFDIVLSTAVAQVLASPLAVAPAVTRNADIKLRFVELHAGQWRNRLETSARGVSRDPDKGVTILSSEAQARTRGECVVVRRDGQTSATESWSTPFVV